MMAAAAQPPGVQFALRCSSYDNTLPDLRAVVCPHSGYICANRSTGECVTDAAEEAARRAAHSTPEELYRYGRLSVAVPDVHVGEAAAAEDENKACRLCIDDLNNMLTGEHAMYCVLNPSPLLSKKVECSGGGNRFPESDLAADWHDNDQAGLFRGSRGRNQ